jgi:hypothetical protein
LIITCIIITFDLYAKKVHKTPMTAKTDKLDDFKNGNYKLIRVQSKLSPVIYKGMIASMESLGINNESTYITMAIKKLNDSLTPKV